MCRLIYILNNMTKCMQAGPMDNLLLDGVGSVER